MRRCSGLLHSQRQPSQVARLSLVMMVSRYYHVHHSARGLALADEPKDLVVAALDRIIGLAVTLLQLFGAQIRNDLYGLWHNAPLYRLTWYEIGDRVYGAKDIIN